MAPHPSAIILVVAISLTSAQNLPHPTRLLTNPVQPPGFSDDPVLTTLRPLVIITPPEVIYGDAGSTTDDTLTPETTVPFQPEVPFETDTPIETTTTTTSVVPFTPTLPFATSTSFPPTTPLPTASSTTTPMTTTTTTTEDAEAQVASTSTDPSSIPFIGPRFVKRSAVSSMANPASIPTAFASAAAGLIAIVGLAMAL